MAEGRHAGVAAMSHGGGAVMSHGAVAEKSYVPRSRGRGSLRRRGSNQKRKFSCHGAMGEGRHEGVAAMSHGAVAKGNHADVAAMSHGGVAEKVNLPRRRGRG